LQKLTLGFTLLLLVVTLLTPTLTLVPAYLAARSFSPQASPAQWISQFLKSYAQYLNELASRDTGEMTYVFCCAQTSYYGFSNKDATITVGPAPVFSIVVSGANISVNKQRGNSQGLIITDQPSATSGQALNVAANVLPQLTQNQSLSTEKLVERFWWPPIEAVRVAYLALCAIALFLGAFSIGLSRWQGQRNDTEIEANSI
jgi:hypothetical protein